MMVRTTAGPRVVTGQAADYGGKGRNAELPPGAPIHVSRRAQAVPLDLNTIRQFNFNQNTDPSVLPERPSTSGGPVAKSSLRGHAERRETRDDLYFDASKYEQATIYFDFPLPGSLPTPTSSPRESTPPPRLSSLPRSFTPESLDRDQDTSVAQMEIGMAIGSPSHPPPAWLPQPQPQQYHNMRNATPETLREYVDDRASSAATPPPAKLKSKWKMFGGLFGGSKKHTHPLSQNFYQLQEDGPQMEADLAQDEEPRDQVRDLRGRTNSERKTGKKKKPTVKRANTVPIQPLQDSASRNGNPEIWLDGHQIDDNVTQQAGGGLMLNVDIPSVEMERYSIMFGSLLSKPGQPNPNSSLLARRQATLDRLKTTTEELAIKEQELEEKVKAMRQPRRATSPQPTRSPAFSLFPHTPSRTGRTPSPNGRTTLHRSNTSPAALSPSRPSFAPKLDNELHATLVEPGPHIPHGYESDSRPQISASTATGSNPVKKRSDFGSIVKGAQAAARVPPPIMTRNFTPEQSHLTLSPDSDEYIQASLPMKPVLTEPAWQMVERLPHTHAVDVVSGSITSHSNHSTSASSSSATTSISTAAHSSTPSSRKNSLATSTMAQSAHNPPQIPASKLNQPSATKSRGRSATTSGQDTIGLPRPSFSRRNLSEISNSSVALSAIIPAPTNMSSTSLNIVQQSSDSAQPSKLSQQMQPHETEEEAHLKSLADVSIARQISVSRQQRQLLIPIRSRTSPTPTTGRARSATTSNTSPQQQLHDQNFPSPLQSLKSRNMVNVTHVTSPLSVVEQLATKAKLKREKAQQSGEQDSTSTASKGNKVPGIIIKGTEKRERKERERERLVEAVKPSTPTLVVVDGSNGNSAETWSGNTVPQREQQLLQQATTPRIGIAERRRRTREERSANSAAAGYRNNSGHERVMLGEGRGHEYRKSERVIIEG